MKKLILLRHGQSLWNLENRFTGWTDVDLSEEGIRQAQRAGALLRDEGFCFERSFTSVLRRAIRTLWIVLDQMGLMWIPVCRSWMLNERHYGALQGLDKEATAKKYGRDLVHQWRRGYDLRPPVLLAADGRHPRFDPRYASLKAEDLPDAESLKETHDRVLPFWKQTIMPAIRECGMILISAHGNSLRALVKDLDRLSDDEIAGLNIPTGFPLVYELDENLQPLRHYYLGDKEEIRRATEAVTG